MAPAKLVWNYDGRDEALHGKQPHWLLWEYSINDHAVSLEAASRVRGRDEARQFATDTMQYLLDYFLRRALANAAHDSPQGQRAVAAAGGMTAVQNALGKENSGDMLAALKGNRPPSRCKVPMR